MMTNLLKELEETWGFDNYQINDIREAMEEFGNSCYEYGFADGVENRKEFESLPTFAAYGKKEDFE